MRTIAHFVGTILALVLMSACARSSVTQPTSTATNIPLTVAVSTPTPDIGAELARQEAIWQRHNIRNYRYQLMVGCFCPMNATMPITVEVRDGAVVSLTDANGAPVALNDPGNGFFMQYTTIPGIYAALATAEFRAADTLTVTYDSTYGFPSEMSADFIEMAVDDELYLSVSAFTPLQ